MLTRTACIIRMFAGALKRFFLEKNGGRYPNSAAWRNPLAGERSQLMILPRVPTTINAVIMGMHQDRLNAEKKREKTSTTPEIRLISF